MFSGRVNAKALRWSRVYFKLSTERRPERLKHSEQGGEECEVRLNRPVSEGLGVYV